jgi:hypothetical protein
LVPYFTKDLKKTRKPINAQSETVATSSMFQAAFAKRRCLVPAPPITSGGTIPTSERPLRRGPCGW